MTFSRWRKSSYSLSNGNCAEVAADWRDSSRSSHNGQCAEVAPCACRRGVLVRDSQDPDGPVLGPFGPDTWQAFVAALKTL